ncbi:hypothetical protein SAMN05660649_04498 [Desulfotomaculum arcticum]|uniref:Uncharacterized protein n=1 Tax=Desulfotruncus arcticus DSM 17038 TaxID=1121424 RepID=A0A1I2YMM4_9FIRM|nr:hypothetical protein SAMN05660649_04498 [Desulfotomaculum arcticum] [Desulfotruncus arcticus DSM 17038]
MLAENAVFLLTANRGYGTVVYSEEYPISFSLEIGHFIIFEVYFINNMDLLLAQRLVFA